MNNSAPLRLSAFPHVLTSPGTVVELANPDISGTFVVLAGLVTGREDKPKNAYVLRDECGDVQVALNGWLVESRWPSDRLEYLRAREAERFDLLAALRVVFGEQ